MQPQIVLVPLLLGAAAPGVERPPASNAYLEQRRALHADGVDADAIAVIREYVSRTRGWKTEEYRLEEKGRDETGIAHYWVVHVDDERPRNPPVAGGGKSFAVDYDPIARKVVKEWGFQ